MIGDIVDYFKNNKERKERKEQIKKDLELFWQSFDELSFEDKKGVLDFAEFLLEDGGSININLEDKEKEKKLREITDIFVALPRKNFFGVYSLLQEKVNKQEQLMSALLPDTEYEDSPEDENEHGFGVGFENEKKPNK